MFKFLRFQMSVDMVYSDSFYPIQEGEQSGSPIFEKPQMDALLGVPDKQTSQGRRDHALMQFLYNSRVCAQEAAQYLSANWT